MIVLTLPYPVECVEFDGARLKSGGYGALRHGGETVRAHRLAYCQAHGVTLASIKGLEVRHTCDNPPCVNPGHLLLGTHTDNMRDMFDRGRRQAAVGERASKAKLSVDEVHAIRAANAAGESQRQIARRVGLNPTSVRKVCRRETWSHVA